MADKNDAVAFSRFKDGIKADINKVLEDVVGPSQKYDVAMIPSWVDIITNQLLTNLQKTSDQFKFIVSVIILQRSNAGELPGS